MTATMQIARPATLASPPLSRLTGVELRKLTDTRAGRWLLVTMLLSAAVLAGVQLAVNEPAGRTLQVFFLGALLPTGILLPVLGILSITSEWSQRTALTTFALVPVRGRVLLAKLAAGAVAALGSVGACLLLAAAANLIALGTDGYGSWRIEAAVLANAMVFQLVNVLMGLAFGMVLLNTPLAIVTYFVLPTAWTVLGGMVGWLADAAGWLDFTRTMEPVLAGATLTAQQWAQFGTSTAVWVLLPLAIGAVRVLRTEIV